MKLLDANVWLSAVWARHSQHQKARQWFDSQDDELAFCRVTQMALLRLTTNPTITQDDALTRRQAWNLNERLLSDPRVRFLTEPQGLVPLWAAFSKRDDRSHLLWTDDYLAAFAQAASAELVTFDRGFHKRYSSVKVQILS
jgi:toxin-antitoxin system PIN domain toxin